MFAGLYIWAERNRDIFYHNMINAHIDDFDRAFREHRRVSSITIHDIPIPSGYIWKEFVRVVSREFDQKFTASLESYPLHDQFPSGCTNLSDFVTGQDRYILSSGGREISRDTLRSTTLDEMERLGDSVSPELSLHWPYHPDRSIRFELRFDDSDYEKENGPLSLQMSWKI
jgi:hypothetical protein